MKKQNAKLRLDRQTIKQLSSSAMRDAAGGLRVTQMPTQCPSVTISDCTKCLPTADTCPPTTTI
jgi:hypothetical protein